MEMEQIINENGRTKTGSHLEIIKLNADNYYAWDKSVTLVTKAINEDLYKLIRKTATEPDFSMPKLVATTITLANGEIKTTRVPKYEGEDGKEMNMIIA